MAVVSPHEKPSNIQVLLKYCQVKDQNGLNTYVSSQVEAYTEVINTGVQVTHEHK